MRFQKIKFGFVFCVLAVTLGHCQVTGVTPDQAPPVPGTGYDYIHSGAETVDPQTGTLRFNLGTGVPPGLDLSIPFGFAYSSGGSMHHVVSVGGVPAAGWTDNSGYLGRGGWAYVVPILTEYTGTFVLSTGSGGNTQCRFFGTYLFADSQGTLHDFQNLSLSDSQQACQPSPMRQQTADSDGSIGAISATMNFNQSTPPAVTVADTDGTVFQFSNAPAKLHTYPGDNQSNVTSNLFSGSLFTSLPDWIETRNGNKLLFNDQRNGAFSITDTVGRPAVQTNGFGGTGTGGSNIVTVSGLGNYTVFWSAPKSHNWTYNAQVTPALSGDAGCPAPSTIATGSQPEVTEITLPNGQSYFFDYDPVTGLLDKITYPTGAVVSYTWTADPLSTSESFSVQPAGVTHYCNLLHDTPAVLSRIVKFDGQTAALEQDFSYSTVWADVLSTGVRSWSSKETTVITKDLVRGTNFTTVYSYSGSTSGPNFQSGANFATRVVVTIKGSDGRTLSTDSKSWAQNWTPFASQPASFLPSEETITLENGQTSQIITCYPADTEAPSPCSRAPQTIPVIMQEPLHAVVAYLPSDRYEYDYGPVSSPGTPGPLLRQTHTDYHQFSANPLGVTIVDRPDKTITYDGSGHNVAETDYAYDESPTSQATAVAHDSTFTTGTGIARGNVTTTTVKCTVLATLQACQDSVTTFQYDQTGQVTSQKDPNGNTTTYSYLDNYSDGNPAVNTNAYLTKITRPQTSGVNHIESFSYALSDGALTVAVDENLNQTTYHYDDPLRRLTETDLPDGGQTTIRYNDAGPHPSVITTTKINPTESLVSTSVSDGMGHTTQTQLNSDPEGVVYVDTVYDGLGRVYQATNPHRTTPSSTDGTTTYDYDALGRQTKVAYQDGGISTADYRQLPAVTVTDPTGKQSRTATDALGRLVEADEPSSASVPNQNDYATMQTDGNFVVYNPSGTALWATGSAGSGGSSIEVQDDGNFVLYIEKWQAGTYATPSSGPFPVQTCSIGSALNAPQTLASGQCIVSSRGQYMLYMQTDGNLVIYNLANNTVVATWSTGTFNNPGAYAVMQGDGNFCVYAANGTFLWMSGTNGTSAERLEMEDDGRIIIFRAAWDSGTSQGWSTSSMTHPACDVGFGTGWTGVLGSGQCFVSPNGLYEVLMQTDGDLALYDLSTNPANRLWDTATGLSPVDPSVAMRTLYTYDALGNLMCIEQHGGVTGTGCSSPPTSDATSPWRVRRFTYDSLSRLLTASNPESGLMSYTYDPNSNLLTKTDARGVVVNYSPPGVPIDALNRVRQKTYSDGTPAVTYTYDVGCCGVTPTNAVGRMTVAVSGNTELIFSYNKMGRITNQWDCPPSGITRGFCYVMSGNYDFLGNLTTLTYPDGRSVATSYNPANRFTGVNLTSFGGVGESYSYYTVPQSTVSSSWGYWPTGAMNRGTFGNGVIETTGYNNRLQINGLIDVKGSQTLFSKAYGYYDSANRNNGNVTSITDGLSSAKNQIYTYDALNRIASAAQADSGFSVTYTVDAWGNMHESGTSNLNQPFDNKNRFQQPLSCSPTIAAYCYDASGNLLNDGVHTYGYDGEGRVKTVDSAAAAYTYNAVGNRVRKDVGSVPTEYFFFGGNIIAELNPATGVYTDYVYGYDKRLAKDTSTDGSGTQFYQDDHLGSTRIMTNSTATVTENCSYGPYGEQLACSPDTSSNHYKFTAKERDSESGLDNFGARYYGSAAGRFMKPDPSSLFYADPAHPQSLNLYSYVQNNPVNAIDPDGQECVWDDGSFDAADDPDTGTLGGCAAAGGTFFDHDTFTAGGGQDWSPNANSDIASLLQPHDIGDEQTIQNESGNKSNVQTPGSIVNVDGTSGQVDIQNFYFYGGDILLPYQTRLLFTLVYLRSVHDLGCVGLGGLIAGGSAAASAPMFPKPFAGGGTSGTSAASILLGGVKTGKSLPAPVGMPGTASFAMRSTADLGRFAGRWLPYVGTAYGAYKANQCLGEGVK